MNTKSEIIDFLKTNKSFLQERYHLSKIGLFGSFARGEATQNSDIDIIIELYDGTQNIHDLKSSLRDFLSDKLGRSVDLAREKYLKPYAKEQILRDTLYV
jgi:predicted nucleotidyltransferase